MKNVFLIINVTTIAQAGSEDTGLPYTSKADMETFIRVYSSYYKTRKRSAHAL